MKKTLTVNEEEYILLEFLYLMDYFNFDSDIEQRIQEFKTYLENKIFKDTFDIGRDILNSSMILEYQFE